MARKKSIEHWRRVISQDTSYTPPPPPPESLESLESLIPTIADEDLYDEIPELPDIDIVVGNVDTSTRRRARRLPALQPRSVPVPVVPVVEVSTIVAEDTARKRAAIHGKTAAEREAVHAAACIAASHALAATGTGSLRRTPPPSQPPPPLWQNTLATGQRAIFDAVFKLAGLGGNFEPNQMRLGRDATAEELLDSVRSRKAPRPMAATAVAPGEPVALDAAASARAATTAAVAAAAANTAEALAFVPRSMSTESFCAEDPFDGFDRLSALQNSLR
jgi:hypothetical protein